MHSETTGCGAVDLSIILPSNTSPERLTQVLEDLRAQCDLALEIIVTNASLEHGDDEDPYPNCIHPVTLQRAAAGNMLDAILQAMLEAHGRWLTFIFPDEGSVCTPTACANAVAAADSSGADVLHCPSIMQYEDGRMRICQHAQPLSSTILHGQDIFKCWLRQMGTVISDHMDNLALAGKERWFGGQYPLWGMLFARPLYARLAEMAHGIPIYRCVQQYLSAWLLALATTYATCKNPLILADANAHLDIEDYAALIMDTFRMQAALPKRFAATGVSSASVCQQFTRVQTAILTWGVNVLLAIHTEETHDNAIVEQALLHYGTSGEAALALAMSIANNARRSRSIINDITLKTDGLREGK